ncbi:transposon Tf2-6 polyprotein [Trichonephila clavipes]|nr:transposon Tf2-6 polyprotein [Trichonephila clavipes]
MRIILKDEEPVCQPPRRLAFTERQEVNKQIEVWLNEGHIAENGTIRPSPTKTLAVRKFPEPTTIKQVQSFLGLTGYFRQHFKIVTDCSAFQKTMQKRELCTRIARWALQLEEFDYEIEHRAGSRMKHVDALSGYPVMMRLSVHFKLFNDYCDEENIQHLQIATCVPRGNGQVERIHRTLIPVLTKLSLDDSTKWYKYVDRLQRILNSTICRSTKWTPFELLVGTKMYNKEDILIKDLLLEEMAKELLEQREFLRNDAKKNLETLQSENRKTYNRR